MKHLLFALAIAALVILACVLAVNAAESLSPRTATETQIACLAEYFRLCAGVQLNEQDIRACIAAHRSSFSPHCLELAKGSR